MEPVEGPTPPLLGDSGAADRAAALSTAGRAASPDSAGALRQAPERMEVALMLGLVLLLNFLPGAYLQLMNLRWGILASQVLFIAAPVFLGIRWFYLDRRAVLPLGRPPIRALAGAVLGATGLSHLLNLAVFWQDRFFPLPGTWKALYEDLGEWHGPLDFLLLLLLVGVVPGVCEEILFRGFVQTGLRRSFESGRWAVVAGALVFAGFHLNPWRFDVLLVIGLFLGVLVQRTGSLVPSMVAHALFNMLSVALAALGEPMQAALVQSPWSHALAGLCLLVSALLLRNAAA
jgi:membrane protease YdiL (CAAX protease family)